MQILQVLASLSEMLAKGLQGFFRTCKTKLCRLLPTFDDCVPNLCRFLTKLHVFGTGCAGFPHILQHLVINSAWDPWKVTRFCKRFTGLAPMLLLFHKMVHVLRNFFTLFAKFLHRFDVVCTQQFSSFCQNAIGVCHALTSLIIPSFKVHHRFPGSAYSCHRSALLVKILLLFCQDFTPSGHNFTNFLKKFSWFCPGWKVIQNWFKNDWKIIRITFQIILVKFSRLLTKDGFWAIDWSTTGKIFTFGDFFFYKTIFLSTFPPKISHFSPEISSHFAQFLQVFHMGG